MKRLWLKNKMLFRKKLIDLVTIFVNNECNLNCLYCFETESSNSLLTFRELRKIIKQSKKLGAREVIIVGKEPLLYRNIFPLINYISELKLKLTLYTNGLLIDKKTALYLYEKKVNVHLKLDTLDEKKYSKIINKKSLFEWVDFEYFSQDYERIKKKIPFSLKCLIETGFSNKTNKNSFLTLEVCITKINYKTVPELARFCMDNHLNIRIERLIKAGKARENYKVLALNETEYKLLYDNLVQILGGDFVDSHKSKICLARKNLVIHEGGHVGLCAVQRSNRIGNVRNKSLKHLIKKKEKILQDESNASKINSFKTCPGRFYFNNN